MRLWTITDGYYSIYNSSNGGYFSHGHLPKEIPLGHEHRKEAYYQERFTLSEKRVNRYPCEVLLPMEFLE